MKRITGQTQQANGLRAAIYARVSDKSQAEEDKTSITEQTNEMEAYCEDKGLTIAARYQEVGRGWTKKRPEFQRMLEDARQGRFDTIVCWKSDRLSRGMYPAAALMEVVEAHQIRLEAVMDAIDMKTFGLMAAIGKIELDNFRERATMGKRGSAKQGRMPTGSIPYAYSIGEDGKPEICEPEAEVVRRIFRQYAHEGVRVPTITRQLASEDAPRRVPGSRWHEAFVGYLLKKEVYKGTWWYGQARHVAMEGGDRVYEQPEDTWIGVPFPPLVDEETWDRAQALKKERLIRSKRNTKTFFLLQHMLRCAECGLRFASRSTSKRYTKSKGKVYRYDLKVPYRNYQCYGMRREGQQCRGRPYIRADQLEGLVWNEVKGMVQNPELIVAGIASLDANEDGGLEKQIAGTERELQRVQLEEDRVIRLYVSGKITEEQLDRQRKFITERLEAVRAELDDYRARQSSATEKRELMENIVEWAARFGQELDDLPDEQRRDVLRLIVEEIVVDGDNNVRITLGIPAKSLVSFAKERSQFGGLRVSHQVSSALEDLGYTNPTPIQEQTIPALLHGEDLVGQAQTGTGKTAAFGIPLAETLDPERGHVQSVVLTPTRELAVQVSEELRSLCRYRGLRVVTVYGGQSMKPQLDALQKGVHIVVGTPGRILDHLGRRTLRLDRVRTVVLDEADEMLDIGFADDIERILRFTPSSRQTALFSATMPKAIHRMVYRHLKRPTWVRIGGEAEPVEQVRQVYYEVASRDKNAGLEELLERGHRTGSDHRGDGQTLIFRRTQRGVERLVDYLRRRGFSVRGIHGRLSQAQRDAVMSAFRAGRLKLLVATNLAARGLDIPAISRVINFDTPQNVEEYVHRIGRTSRMGRPGTAITFVGESEFDDFEPIQRHAGANLERRRLALYS